MPTGLRTGSTRQDRRYPASPAICALEQRPSMASRGTARFVQGNSFEKRATWSGADTCPASDAALAVPPARLGGSPPFRGGSGGLIPHRRNMTSYRVDRERHGRTRQRRSCLTSKSGSTLSMPDRKPIARRRWNRREPSCSSTITVG